MKRDAPALAYRIARIHDHALARGAPFIHQHFARAAPRGLDAAFTRHIAVGNEQRPVRAVAKQRGDDNFHRAVGAMHVDTCIDPVWR